MLVQPSLRNTGLYYFEILHWSIKNLFRYIANTATEAPIPPFHPPITTLLIEFPWLLTEESFHSVLYFCVLPKTLTS